MEFHLAMLLAFNPLQPIVDGIHAVIVGIYGGVGFYPGVHNYGWALIMLAALIRVVMWPLTSMQFKSMKRMQELSPKLKALQAKFKDNREKLNEATMALYKDTGVNPLAGCFPLLLQLPVLYSVFFAINGDKAAFQKEGWLWIGSSAAASVPNHILGSNLATPDYVLLGLYIISMYFSVRFTSPASPDPQVAQQQKIMAFISPVMIGIFGVKYAWPSGLIIYWLAFNVFMMAQQFYLINKYHTNPAAAGPHPVAEATAALPALDSRNGSASNAPASTSKNGGGGGSRAARRRRSSRR